MNAMSYKQMKYFQDLGDYVAAYKIARADWDANPNLHWPKNAIAWLLIRMMKTNARAFAQQRFLLQLEEFRNLGLPEADKKLWGAVAWPIRDIVKDSFEMQWFTPEFGDNLFDAMRAMPFHKPSESYSAMVKAFIKLAGLWPQLPNFIEWWGLDNFTDYDYRRYPENGVLESLVEKVMTAYLLSLQHSDEGRQPSPSFCQALNTLAFRSQEQADKIYKIMTFDFAKSEKSRIFAQKFDCTIHKMLQE